MVRSAVNRHGIVGEFHIVWRAVTVLILYEMYKMVLNVVVLFMKRWHRMTSLCLKLKSQLTHFR